MKWKVVLEQLCDWLLFVVCVCVCMEEDGGLQHTYTHTCTPKETQNKGREIKHVSRHTFLWIISLSGVSVHLSNFSLLPQSFNPRPLSFFSVSQFFFFKFLALFTYCFSVAVSLSLSSSLSLLQAAVFISSRLARNNTASKCYLLSVLYSSDLSHRLME